MWVAESYLLAVRRAGAIPLLVPPGEENVDRLLTFGQGVVVTGGAFDIHPHWYGEQPEGRLDRVEETRTALEIAGEIDVYTNRNIVVETLKCAS